MFQWWYWRTNLLMRVRGAEPLAGQDGFDKIRMVHFDS